ncbi:MAG TPA: DUF2339 domain-containing protein [Fimbriimonadaceae bacterium]|nr:DUF2339 domain-containing protein [Fimbriimonadaceae bacterium]
MARERIDAVEDRLRELERRLEIIDIRLRSVERWRAGAPETPRPIPQIRPVEAVPAPPPVIPGRWQRFEERLAHHPESPPQAPTGDTEYDIGAKLLPKLGALLVLGAILYFVAWGYSAGWITKPMIFTGEILFCLAFLGVGQWRRSEREQFGQILTGIGSFGLYASFAGGHLAQRLFSGEVLVVSFMALSLGNLGYGLWSRSRAFFAIGLLGGFAAALLPMREDKTTLNAILHLAIVAPAALIAVRRKWADMAGALWLASALALIPLMETSIPWQIRVGTLYVASLAAVAAYLHAATKNRFDPQGFLAPVMLFVTGLIGLAVEHNRPGAMHLVLLGAGSALAAFAAQAVPLHRDRTFVAAIAIPATLAPVCFERIECLSIYISLSLLAAAVGMAVRPLRMRAAAFAGVEFVLATCAYLVIQSWNPLAASAEAWLLGGLMAAGAASAYVAVKSGGPEQPFTLGAMAILMPFVGRLGVVTLTGSSVSASPEFAAAQALTLFAIAAILLTAKTRWISAMVAMWASFAVALGAYAWAVSFGDVPSVQDAVLAGVLTLTAVAGLPVAVGAAAADFRKAISGSAGILVGLMLMRFFCVLASMRPDGPAPWLVACLVASGYSVAAAVVSLVRKSDAATAVAWAMFAAAGIVYMSEAKSPALEMASMSGLFASFLAASAAIKRQAGREPQIWHVVALLGWLVFARWFSAVLVWQDSYSYATSGLTVAWILYALALLSLGFALRARELRYWSFAVMFATVSKILLFDLANTSTPFRVSVLLGLGLLMLGGGYWYIRGRHTPTPI